jgi:hypothetical protein
MSTQEDQLIELDQTLLTENETHDKEEAEKQTEILPSPVEPETQSQSEIPDENKLLTQSEENDFVKIETTEKEENLKFEEEESSSDEEEQEESSSEEELSSSSESEESDSSEEKSTEACSIWLPLLGFTFLLFALLFCSITFFPSSRSSEGEWIKYCNHCCSTTYGQMRCLLDITCRDKLNRWIDLQPENATSNYLNRCCYLYAPYDTSYFFSQYYCDPFCLKPRSI